jgi:ATP-dependent Clp protease ATP-binding subunit ClpC
MDNNFSQRVRDIMAYSREEAGRLQNNYIGPEHLMLGILRDGAGLAVQVLQDFDIDLRALKENIDSQIRYVQEPYDGSGGELVINKNTDDEDDDMQGRSSFGGQSGSQGKSASDTPVLDNFGTDITRAAIENRLDPVVGRDKEIERIAQILSRRKKNNPVLIGDPGVGKSAIAAW